MNDAAKKALKNQYKNSKQVGGVYRICCVPSGECWVRSSPDLKGAKNRFEFQCATKLSPEPAMAPAWKQYGAGAFGFEILEEIEKKETQTSREFLEDVAALLEMWNEKQGEGDDNGAE
ncbi:GIY-YIG nuclease family protein [Clostridium merdae]|uniref:GIY-YIG nuclease family protein n=1 Tax=Clostridium merdae TaxID=1958780 RepID=UPI000A26DE1E|nr:GIY-YIG nuclease family protein [Clostridium merdae]